jgi:hypothetical protein
VATDDGVVIPACQDRLDKAKLAQAALQGVEFVRADAPGVGWVRPELVDGDLFDGHEG